MPGPRRKSLTKAEAAAVQAARDPKLSAERLDRLDWLANEIAHIVVALASANGHMDGWNGNTTIDATVFGVFNKYGAPFGGPKAPSEYDAGWYLRTADHQPTGNWKEAIKRVDGNETHLVVASTNDGNSRNDKFPYLVLAPSCSRPSLDPAGFAVRAYQQVKLRHGERTSGALVVADRGYFANSKEEKL